MQEIDVSSTNSSLSISTIHGERTEKCKTIDGLVVSPVYDFIRTHLFMISFVPISFVHEGIPLLRTRIQRLLVNRTGWPTKILFSCFRNQTKVKAIGLQEILLTMYSTRIPFGQSIFYYSK